MATAELKFNGTTIITETAGVANLQNINDINPSNLKFNTTNHEFTIKGVDAPIVGANYSTNDDPNSGQLAIYNGANKLWSITEQGLIQNPNIPAFYGSDLSPSTAGKFAKANVILVNKGSNITNVNPDGDERTRFNAPVTGLYHAWMGNIGLAAAGTLRMHFYINGTSQYPQLRNAQTTNNGTSASMVGIFEMNAGDYLEWYSYDQYGWYNSIYAHIGCYLIG